MPSLIILMVSAEVNQHLMKKRSGVEELETIPASTKPMRSHHRSPGGERCGL